MFLKSKGRTGQYRSFGLVWLKNLGNPGSKERPELSRWIVFTGQVKSMIL